MTVGIEAIVWTVGALLGLAALAFVVELLPPFLLHESRLAPSRDDRSNVANGVVFCRVQHADLDVGECVGCPHLRVMDGRGTFIVCDGRAAAAVALIDRRPTTVAIAKLYAGSAEQHPAEA